MISITSDIHHQGLKTGNQKHSDLTEVETALIMHKIFKEFKIKGTYFISGKAFEDHWSELQKICGDSNFDIGGHNYYCFKPELFHRITNKLFDSYNGPKSYQTWETKKTQRIIKEKTQKDCIFWRNHMYMHGKYTDEILPELGIKICSDGVQKNSNGLSLISNDYFHLPINVIPDHEHLIHAERTEEWMKEWVKRYNWSDDFGSESYPIEIWRDILISQVHENEKRGILSNIIIHPITMYLCDNFESLRFILDALKGYQFINFSDIYSIQKQKASA